MMTDNEILALGRSCLQMEADAVRAQMGFLGEEFVAAVRILANVKGRVVVSGIGKSGAIGRKIASTFSSTGTPSFFLHPAEGIHGDLGMITSDDVVLGLSYSGNTEELGQILPVIKRIGATLIAMTGNPESQLARKSDLALVIPIEREACPLNLAPTTSTTVFLAVGDALAVVLLKQRGFQKEDFALFHPGGALGKQLLLYVSDLMHTGASLPVVPENEVMRSALMVMTEKRLGIVGVVNDKAELVGCVTDGDLRRFLGQKGSGFLDEKIGALCSKKPKTLKVDALAVTALKRMEDNKITVLFVTDAENKPVGVLHMHDILSAGIH